MLHHPIVPPSAWRAGLKIADRGADVASWQAVLILNERNIGDAGADGVFGKRTHQATIAWQHERKLPTDGIVNGSERALLSRRTWLEPKPLDLSSMQVILAKNWSRNVPAGPKIWIVIHCMEAPEGATTAINCAEWFAGNRGEAPRTSAHFCVDADRVVQCVPEDRIAWHAPGANRLGIGIELAGYARQSLAEWRDDYSALMLNRAAGLVARLCRQKNIPTEFAAAADLRNHEAGITTHAEVSKAFGKSTHTDPGRGFPMGDFLSSVRVALRAV